MKADDLARILGLENQPEPRPRPSGRLLWLAFGLLLGLLLGSVSPL